MLILSRKCGESLMINEEIEIKVTEITGDRVKIGIQAPRDFKIFRKELCQTMEDNKKAAHAKAASRELLDFLQRLPTKDGDKEQTPPTDQLLDSSEGSSSAGNT